MSSAARGNSQRPAPSEKQYTGGLLVSSHPRPPQENQLPAQCTYNYMPDDQINAAPPEVNPNPPAFRTSITRSTSVIDENDYPEGVLRAWLVVVGGWFGLFSTFGLINSMGTLQAYVENHQLKDYSSRTTGWIFGVYVFLTFFSLGGGSCCCWCCILLHMI